MHLHLEIPEPLYVEAVQYAAANGQSVEAYALEAMRQRIGEEDAVQRMFTPDRLAKMAAADAEIDAGEFLSTEQVGEHFAQKRAAWTQSQQP